MTSTSDSSHSTAAACSKGHRLRCMRTLPAALVLMIVLSVLSACEEEKKEVVSDRNNPEVTPTMLTRQVETLISDSGILRYRITSPLWLVFEEAKVPRWVFPKGLKLEKYDDYFRKEATVEADSAIYWKDKKLWELVGNVRIGNIAKEKIHTNQIFWDQNSKKVYSDSFIHIEQPDRILEGYGFESNDRLTSYTIRKVSGIFPVDGLKKQGGVAPIDSAGAASPTPASKETTETPQD